jgi:hypothetical protein
MTEAKNSFWRDNGLSIVLGTLFVVFLCGQAVSGWLNYDEQRTEHGRVPKSFTEYLHTGAFGEAVFENWESEFLQMGVYVILTVFLFQRGSSESKDPDKKEAVDEEPSRSRHRKNAPLPVRKGGVLLSIYNYSLFIAFMALFAISFAGHAIFGLRAYNEEALEHGQAAVTVGGYMTSSQFWFESLQNWQSEFLAIFCIVVFSIWLRQKGSPESKPVATPHHSTGG